MKRCPECRRDYVDDTLLYCLDDGNALLEGPASGKSEPSVAAGGPFDDGPQTAILHSTAGPREAPTRAQIHTTEQTAVLPRGAEAEPPGSVGGLSEKYSFSANRAAKRLIAVIAAAILLVGGFFGYRYFSTANSKQIESIAVMPFVNASGNADAEYLSDGMTETLISSLTQVPNLNVKARSSVFRYKGKETDTKTLGKELNVQAILSGRVGHRGDQLTLSLELVDVASENAIWSQQYTRNQSGMASLQREIARDVSSQLKARLSGAEMAKVEKSLTTDPKAYELYLKGRFYWNTRTVEDMHRALDHFKRAVDADPNYALAYTGIADANAIMVAYQVQTSHEGMPKAREAALKALQLDDTLAEAHTALAGVYAEYDYDYPAAEHSYKRAIELNPNYGTARQWYAEMLGRQGRADESLRESSIAIQIDPQSQTFNRIHAIGLLLARRYSEAEAQAKKTLELDRSLPFPYIDLFDIYLMQGKYAEAVESYATWAEMRGEKATADEARSAFAKAGWNGALRAMLKTPNIRNYTVAGLNALLGNNDEAFAALDRTFEERTFEIQQIKVDPLFDSLRDDPRYRDLLKRMGLPE